MRQDLNLYSVDPDADGTPAWVLHDPLANRYFRLDERSIELLGFITSVDAQIIADRATESLGRLVTGERVEELLHFLRLNNLVVADEVQLEWHRRQSERLGNPGWFSRLAKSYLFIRIPLWNPDRFLERTLPFVSWLGSRYSLTLFLIMALSGIYLVSRQLDVFLATFMYFFSFSGLITYLAVLVLAKIMHELGHAYVAKAFGCRVPVIGVAFLVGWPVLYTDTSDAWKLGRRRQRMLIGLAGVGVELAIACISLLLWTLVAEGSLSSILFVLATTTWLLSVFVNFNPLMRFDGYYLLSDWLRMPNLEFRSFEMAKWWLREKLFGLGIEPTEPVKGPLIFYAFAIWVYRFFLFLGIALLVYYFFFKLLGIALFFLELAYFIVRPLIREVQKWWSLKDSMHWNFASLRSLFISLLLLLVLILPWKETVVAPALMDARYSRLYTPLAGKLQKLHVSSGQFVQEGDLIAEFVSPQLNFEFSQAQSYYKELGWRRASMGFDPEMRQQSLVVAAELLTQNQKLQGLLDRRNQLQLKAPFSGLVVDTTKDLFDGMWLAKGEALLAVQAQTGTRLKAYVKEQFIARIEQGMSVTFYPQDPAWGEWEAVVDSIDLVGVRELDNLYLASLFGGDIAVLESEQQELITQESFYIVNMSLPEEQSVPTQVLRGSVRINARAEGLISSLYRSLLVLLQRETGF